MKKRFIQALVAYAALAITACFLLTGKVLATVAIILAAFALKSALWYFKPLE